MPDTPADDIPDLSMASMVNLHLAEPEVEILERRSTFLS